MATQTKDAAEKKPGLTALFMMHYHKSKKIWFLIACATVILGAMLPSGLMGMICLLMAKGFLDIAEEAHA